jgi:cystathionine beta-lyase
MVNSAADWDATTRLVHAGDSPAARAGLAVKGANPAIQRASTVLLPDAAALYAHGLHSYGRGGLGVQAALESALSELEQAHATKVFSSGAAAISGALMSVLEAGDEVLVADGVYRPTRRCCDELLTRFGITTRYFASRATADDIMAMAGPTTRAVFLESPASLSFEFQDVPAIAAAARARGLITLIDNTWAAGLLFKPLQAGVDISIQALTKYASGGSDVFMGSAAIRDPKLAARVADTVQTAGWAVSPDDCYSVLRSLRTLPFRMARHGASALEVASWLETQPEVARVLCPALPSSPDHAIWRRDYSGICGLFGLVLKPGATVATHAFLNALHLFGLGFSWGGFESLAIACDPQIKRTAKPWDAGGPLIRLHVGLECPCDLITDLRTGLDAYGVLCEEQA